MFRMLTGRTGPETGRRAYGGPPRPFGVRTLDDMPARAGSRVLVRATLDFPLDDRSPSAQLRFELLRSTVRDLLATGARVTVFGDMASHDGARPSDQPDLYQRIRGLGAEPVLLAGPEPSAQTSTIIDALVARHDVFVNDCFQWSYLPIDSLMAAEGRLPCFAGRELEHNLRAMAPILLHPDRPFTAVLGGDEVRRRLHGLRGMVLRADDVLVGGAMSVPLLRAIGREDVGSSPAVLLDECRDMIGLGARVQHRVHLPHDLLVRHGTGPPSVLEPGQIGDGEVLDIGPRTIQEFAELIAGSGTVVWTGALGHVEDDSGPSSSLRLAQVLPPRSTGIVLGGDALTRALGRQGGLPADVTIVTATDPLLELLKAGDLAALRPLRDS